MKKLFISILCLLLIAAVVVVGFVGYASKGFKDWSYFKHVEQQLDPESPTTPDTQTPSTSGDKTVTDKDVPGIEPDREVLPSCEHSYPEIIKTSGYAATFDDFMYDDKKHDSDLTPSSFEGEYLMGVGVSFLCYGTEFRFYMCWKVIEDLLPDFKLPDMDNTYFCSEQGKVLSFFSGKWSDRKTNDGWYACNFLITQGVHVLAFFPDAGSVDDDGVFGSLAVVGTRYRVKYSILSEVCEKCGYNRSTGVYESIVGGE